MPQRAILKNKTSVFAFEKTDHQWEALKEVYQNDELVLPCCNTPAMPKENQRGTRFFSHLPFRKKACSWKAVGPVHESILSTIAKAMKQSGWSVVTEFNEGSLRADVIFFRPNLDIKFTLQIELKKRNEDEILNEQEKLISDGFYVIHLISKDRRKKLKKGQKTLSIKTSKHINTPLEAMISFTRTAQQVSDKLKRYVLIAGHLSNGNLPFQREMDQTCPKEIYIHDNGELLFKISLNKNISIHQISVVTHRSHTSQFNCFKKVDAIYKTLKSEGYDISWCSNSEIEKKLHEKNITYQNKYYKKLPADLKRTYLQRLKSRNRIL